MPTAAISPFARVDADALEHLLAARVRLDRQQSGFDRLLHAFRAALDDHERHLLALKLMRHDAADAPVAADDEVVRKFFEHTCIPAPREALRQSSLDDDSGDEREGVERGADAAEQQDNGEGLPGPRRRGRHVHGGEGDDRDEEGAPQRPAFDPVVPDRADDDDEKQKGDRKARALSPEPPAALRIRHELALPRAACASILLWLIPYAK